jgi:hypothetical protein
MSHPSTYNEYACSVLGGVHTDIHVHDIHHPILARAHTESLVLTHTYTTSDIICWTRTGEKSTLLSTPGVPDIYSVLVCQQEMDKISYCIQVVQEIFLPPSHSTKNNTVMCVETPEICFRVSTRVTYAVLFELDKAKLPPFLRKPAVAAAQLQHSIVVCNVLGKKISQMCVFKQPVKLAFRCCVFRVPRVPVRYTSAVPEGTLCCCYL